MAAPGVVFPLRCVLAVPLASLSLPSRSAWRSRADAQLESCLEIVPTPTRERCALDVDPRCLPSIGSPCPAAPFRASGSGFDSTRGCPPPYRALVTFGATAPFGPIALDPRSRVLVASELALLWISMPPDDFCNLTRRVGTPSEPSIPRTRVGFFWGPASGRHPRDASCVGYRDASPHRAPASYDLRAAACARRPPLTWKSRS